MLTIDTRRKTSPTNLLSATLKLQLVKLQATHNLYLTTVKLLYLEN